MRGNDTDDLEVLPDWDIPFIHRTVDSDRMTYCALFDCNANSSKNKVTCSWFQFRTEPTLFLKSKLRRNTVGFARSEKTHFDCDPDQGRR